MNSDELLEFYYLNKTENIFEIEIFCSFSLHCI